MALVSGPFTKRHVSSECDTALPLFSFYTNTIAHAAWNASQDVLESWPNRDSASLKYGVWGGRGMHACACVECEGRERGGEAGFILVASASCPSNTA